MKVDLDNCIDIFNCLHLYAQKSSKEGFYRIYSYQPDYDSAKGVYARRNCELVARIFDLSGVGVLEWCPVFVSKYPEFAHIKCVRETDKTYTMTLAPQENRTMAQALLEAIHTIKPVKRLREAVVVNDSHSDLGHLPLDHYVKSYRPVANDFNFGKTSKSYSESRKPRRSNGSQQAS